MPKDTKKKKQKINDDQVDQDLEETKETDINTEELEIVDVGEEAEHEDELDDEVLEALNVKKKKAKNIDPNVDYIPELERDFDPDQDDF